MRFCKFDSGAPGGPTIYVNPTKVRFVEPMANGHSRICFDQQHSMVVPRPPADVAKEPEAALR